ncbi:MAG: hypothetical protein K8F91_15155 [Candidatus Obscuribacterales bacterium]|nr:hypothetical protein [Candidatus Obscuribacterales bacterium]
MLLLIVGLAFQALSPDIAHAGESKSTKKSPTKLAREKGPPAPNYKAYFKKWFEKFYGSLYYAKSLADIRQYFSANFLKGWDGMTDGQKIDELKRMKKFYVGDPKLDKLTFGSDASTAEIEMTGSVVVDEKRGYGKCVYRMVKETKGWLINSSSVRGEYTKVLW